MCLFLRNPCNVCSVCGCHDIALCVGAVYLDVSVFQLLHSLLVRVTVCIATAAANHGVRWLNAVQEAVAVGGAAAVVSCFEDVGAECQAVGQDIGFGICFGVSGEDEGRIAIYQADAYGPVV